jgi:hypothetical protein
MLYLHSHKPTILHSDLKSPKLFVTSEWGGVLLYRELSDAVYTVYCTNTVPTYVCFMLIALVSLLFALISHALHVEVGKAQRPLLTPMCSAWLMRCRQQADDSCLHEPLQGYHLRGITLQPRFPLHTHNTLDSVHVVALPVAAVAVPHTTATPALRRAWRWLSMCVFNIQGSAQAAAFSVHAN